MSSYQPVNITISDGPSADRIIDALKYAFTKKVTMTLWFELVMSEASMKPYGSPRGTNSVTRVPVHTVLGIEYESGAPGMFILTVHILNGTYKAFYNANSRKGNLVEKL